MSVEEIVKRLENYGGVDSFDVMFLPGGTLAQAKSTLMKLGYESAEIDAAFSKNYDHPVLATKPAEMDLEGYIFGETYRFKRGVSVEEIAVRCLDELNRVVIENDLVERYRGAGLTLYEGITLASIIQREALIYEDQRQVAQVFLLRLKIGMNLGSDPTYQYIADKLGIERDYNLDNPYNTRRYGGLPPGPIATPGVEALESVIDPAEGDYLFFLNGDDDTNYYGRTDAEHQQNIKNHCKVKCKLI